MKLTNQLIYLYASALGEAFQDSKLILPVKINFYLQKNITTLIALMEEIENERMAIIKNYGTLNEDGQSYTIPQDKLEIAQKELNDLLALEQEVQIYKVKLSHFGDDLKLTTGQMNALMFMIEDEE